LRRYGWRGGWRNGHRVGEVWARESARREYRFMKRLK
jgi:hypothetical protein